jgi:hypothetical protein
VPNEKMGSRRLPQPPDVAAGIVVIAVAGFLGFVALSMVGIGSPPRAGSRAPIRSQER